MLDLDPYGITAATLRSERMRGEPAPGSAEARHLVRTRFRDMLDSASWDTLWRYRADEVAQAWHGRDLADLDRSDANRVIELVLRGGQDLRDPDWKPPERKGETALLPGESRSSGPTGRPRRTSSRRGARA